MAINPTHRLELEEVVTRLTPEQVARVLSFAESPTAETAATDAAPAKSFAEPVRRRLRELTAQSEAETLTEAERAEYIALAEGREAADAERLETATTLAKLHDIPFAQALAELDAGANERG
ncbi:MAG: hypothetical protein M3430_21235 [Acidobacteriota bacterium]|nr:hypothetical protein [Acidobacteriota bacterium]